MSLSPAMSYLLVVAVLAGAAVVASLLLGDASRLVDYWRRERRARAGRVEGADRDGILEWLDDPSLSLDERARLRRQLEGLDETARRLERAVRGRSA